MSEASSDGRYGLSRPTTGQLQPAPDLPYLPPTPPPQRLPIGLIGCGGIAEYHLRAYHTLGLDVVALCDRHPERAAARQREFCPSARVYTTPGDLLAHADLAVVDIATHPAERGTLVRAALDAGKHVLSQKPFTLDLAEARALITRADELGLRLAVNQNGRWAPHFSYLTQALRAGLIGDVTSVDFTLQWDHTWTKGTRFEEVHHLVLYDFAMHWFDIASVWLGGRRPRTVCATVAHAVGQTFRPPCLAQVLADYGDAQVRLACNAHVIHGQEDRTTVCGTHGTLRSFGPSLTEQTVTLHRAEGEASPALVGNWFENGFQGTMSELLNAIVEQRAPSHTAATVLPALEFGFAAIASAEAGGQPMEPGEVTKLPT